MFKNKKWNKNRKKERKKYLICELLFIGTVIDVFFYDVTVAGNGQVNKLFHRCGYFGWPFIIFYLSFEGGVWIYFRPDKIAFPLISPFPCCCCCCCCCCWEGRGRKSGWVGGGGGGVVGWYLWRWLVPLDFPVPSALKVAALETDVLATFEALWWRRPMAAGSTAAWIQLDWSWWNWIELYPPQIELTCGSIDLDFLRLTWIGLAWLGLAWLGLAWLGLDWHQWDWLELYTP